jgi:prepilin-type N-terminal cleavage/methylation domain-containing protein
LLSATTAFRGGTLPTGEAGPVKRKASGFTLIELSIVLLITGILMAAYLDASRLWLENRRHGLTMERMKLVQDAMAHYIALNGAYPCPAPPVSYKPDVQYDDCAALNLTQMTQAEKHGVLFINYNNRQIIEGAVPYRLLNIPREAALDGWDNQFTYAITAEMTGHDTTFTANRGGIGIVDEDDTSLINPPASAIWALVSHGPDGSGAWHDGAAKAKACPPGRRETVNCSHEGRFAVVPMALADTKGFYDDIVFYRTWVDYLPGSLINYCSIPLHKGSLEPSLVQDGVMIEVCGDAAQALTNNGTACRFLICHGGQFVPGVIDLTSTGGNPSPAPQP